MYICAFINIVYIQHMDCAVQSQVKLCQRPVLFFKWAQRDQLLLGKYDDNSINYYYNRYKNSITTDRIIK